MNKSAADCFVSYGWPVASDINVKVNTYGQASLQEGEGLPTLGDNNNKQYSKRKWTKQFSSSSTNNYG